MPTPPETRAGSRPADQEAIPPKAGHPPSLAAINALFQRGVAVKILEGIAAGEHTERSFLLDLALALAADRRRDISRKTRGGLAAAARRGRKGGRPTVMTLGVSEITVRRALAQEQPAA